MIALTSSATRRHKPIVILTGPAYGARCSTPVSVRLCGALSSMAARVRCCCTPRRIFRALFGARVSTVVAVITVAAMLWHNVSIADTIAAQEAVGLDCLLCMPWAAVWLMRTAMSAPGAGKGGEL